MSSAHLDMRPSTTLGPTGGTVGWSENPADHTVLFRPRCGHDGCGVPSMLWRRCGVRKEVFGRCGEHTTQGGKELREAFEKHGHWQGGGIRP